MKVLVTGAKGMLGQATMDVWSDHDVVGVDIDELNITKPLEVARAITLYRPEALINCAAYTAVDKCETEEKKATLINGTAVGYLARVCAAAKIPVVQISTDYVFDGTNANGYAEDDQPAPVNAYGRTKLHGEEQLRLNTERYYLVRTSWLYGPSGKNFVQTMVDLGRSKPEVQVVDDQHGKPTYTYDLAGFIKSLLLQRAPFGVYHGVNEEATTWYDLTKEIFRLTHIKTPIKPISSQEFPRPAKRPQWSTLLNTKRPWLRAWPSALRDYLDWLGYTGVV